MAMQDPKQPEDSHWRYSWLYFNKEDPKLFVQTPSDWYVRYTINAGHPLGPWILAGVFLVPVVAWMQVRRGRRTFPPMPPPSSTGGSGRAI
jgi:uncharacterized membrane protein